MSKLHQLWPTRQQSKSLLWLLLFDATVVFIFLLSQRKYGCDWTGFGECLSKDVRLEKTLWDWLQLLVVPLLIGTIAIYFNYRRAKTDQEIAFDNQRDALLREYLDRMAELLIDKSLRKSDETDEVRSVARARTLTVVRRLDRERKGNVVRFLHESKLIGTDKAYVNLADADLRGIHLLEASLDGDNFSRTVMTRANLRHASLEGTCFEYSSLTLADLRYTYMTDAKLTGAYLEGADLREATLISANLNSCDLRGANLRGAALNHADLRGADIRGADLREARLRDAKLESMKFNEQTLWPSNVDPIARGAIFTN